MLGLSRGAITTRKLKGVKRDKEHGGYTGSAPYGEGKSLRPVVMELLCLEDQGAESLYLDLELLSLVLNPPPGRAFIYTGRRPPAYRVPMPVYTHTGSVSTLSYLTIQVINYMAVYTYRP